MKRKLLKLGLLLLAGAIINVAVAWGCARWSTAPLREGDIGIGFGMTEQYKSYMAGGIPTIEMMQPVNTLIGWPTRCARIDRPWFRKPVDNPRPIWTGFAINTIFYAAIVWLLFFAPFQLRRWRRIRRIKRGLCPACAYPVGTSDRCTECGGSVKT